MHSVIICSEKKHPEGKLVKLCANILEDQIHGVILTGDFFVEPEEAMEEAIKNLITLKCNLNELEDKVIEVIKKTNVKLIGIDEDDIRVTLKKIIHEYKTL